MCTLNSKCNTKVASGLAAQNCQFDNSSHNLAWCSFPDEPNSGQVHPFSAPPPQEFTRQQPKIFHRPRSQDNTPGRQFSLKLTKTHLRRFYKIRMYAHKTHSKCTMYGRFFRTEFRWSLDGVWMEWKMPRSRSKVEKTERSNSVCTPYTYSVPTASIVRS